jgi:hypothetical protein
LFLKNRPQITFKRERLCRRPTFVHSVIKSRDINASMKLHFLCCLEKGATFECRKWKCRKKYWKCRISLTHPNQGDQIRRIFAYWVIVFFGYFDENNRSSPNICTSFILGKKLSVNFGKKKWFGLHIGRFFTNSSDHTGLNSHTQTNIHRTSKARCPPKVLGDGHVVLS